MISEGPLLTSLEIMITSSSFCIVPVSRFNDRVFEDPIPGPITRQLMWAFSTLANCDFVQQIVSAVQGKAC
jgi:branched-chain amino acid aminotransferase